MLAGREDHCSAVSELTKRYLNVFNYTDLPEITLEQIQHFFEHYKDLEAGKWVRIAGMGRCGGGPTTYCGRRSSEGKPSES